MTEPRKPPKARGATAPRNGPDRTAVLLEEIQIQMRVVIERVLDTPTKREFAELKDDLGEVKRDLGEVKKDLGEVKKDLGEVKKDTRKLKEEVAEVKEDLRGAAPRGGPQCPGIRAARH